MNIALANPDVNELYVNLLRMLLNHGEHAAPRGQVTKEILGVSLTLTDAYRPVITIPSRQLNYHFMAAEAMWILMGRNDVEMLAAYNSQVRQFSDDGETFAGAYGPRFLTQKQYIVETLKADPWSRQAVIQVWQETPQKTRDVPCTLSWQFLLRSGKLHLIATMRSSDAWLGIPYDFHSFSAVQRSVASALDAGVGNLELRLGSSHLYEVNFQRAKQLVDAHDARLTEYQAIGAMPVHHHIPGQVYTAEAAARIGPPIYENNILNRLDEVTPPWRPYAELLAHRFMKDDQRLTERGDHPFCLFVAKKEW